MSLSGGSGASVHESRRAFYVTEAMVSEFCATLENRCGTVRGIGPAVREALAELLAGNEIDTALNVSGHGDNRSTRPADRAAEPAPAASKGVSKDRGFTGDLGGRYW